MKESQQIPVLRARKEEIDGIVYMMCSLTKFQQAEKTMEKRLRSVPNAYRDLRMINSVLSKLLGQMKLTLPEEKRNTLDAILPDVRYKITYGRQVGRSEEPVSGIYTADLDMLCAVSHDAVCKLCDGNCDRCALGKCFDRMIGTNRDKGESYTFMDMEKGFDVLGIRHGG
jgi:hypothetical protein